MNRTEHLLACLAEECAEVAQAVGKALRFGLADGYPGTTRTNALDIARELNDLFAVAEMLEEEGVIPIFGVTEDVFLKKAKVKEFMRYAEQRGTLTPNAKDERP